MLGSALDMSFADFFWYRDRPSMFFTVELGAVFSAVIVYFLFRREKQPIVHGGEKTLVTDYLPTALLLGTILLLICASFAPEEWKLPGETNGIICCAMLLLGLGLNLLKRKKLDAVLQPLRTIDFQTLLLLAGLFLMIGGIAHEGVVDALARQLVGLGGVSAWKYSASRPTDSNLSALRFLRRKARNRETEVLRPEGLKPGLKLGALSNIFRRNSRTPSRR